MKIKSILIMVIFLMTSISAFAEFFWMPGIFTNSMVLQQGEPVRIWGVAEPNKKIVVHFNWKNTETTSDKNGQWSLMLEPMKANKNPMAMTVYVDGIPRKEVRDILVGEVWIIGGQSNMQWPMKRTDEFERAKADANKYEIRMFHQPAMGDRILRRDTPPKSRWIKNTKELENFSAVGYYFAEGLAKKKNIPVALIFTPFGGAKMIAYTPEKAMSLNEEFDRYYKKFMELAKNDTDEKSIARWKKANDDFDKLQEQRKKEGKPVQEKHVFMKHKPQKGVPYPYNWRNTPAYFYNKMVAPILPYTTKGVVWYQGCSDASIAVVPHFKDMFTVLVNEWRNAAKKDNLYFYAVQLASFKSDFQFVRFEQIKGVKQISHSGIINIIDTGAEKDIHPWDKHIVGTRMANLVLQDVYGFKNLNAKAPEMKSVKYDGNKAVVKFDSFGSEIECKGQPRGFEVLVGDKWHNAKVELNGQSVVVSSAGGQEISGVRYLWKGWAKPDVCIYSKAGLPAFSFEHKR